MKFKVWCCDRKEWESDFTAIGQNGILIEIGGGSWRPISPKNHKVVWNIDRKDKKGEALYQGDIVIWDKPGFTGKRGPGVIGWFNWPGISGFAILDGKGNLHKDGGYSYDAGFEFETYAEKIGSICENPQLMEGKKWK